MKPGEAGLLLDKYKDKFEEHDEFMRAVTYSKIPGIKMFIMIRRVDDKNGLIDEGANKFPLEFNLEIGQALYQAKFNELKEELEEIKRRIDLWK